MSLLECREKYKAGNLNKPAYIEEMYKMHMHLFEYANLIKQTDISSIEIKDDQLILTARSSGIKLLCESLDKRAAPIEILNFDFYEKTDSDMIFRLIEPNSVFFDIGGNIGWYTMNVAKRHQSISIHTFEPIPFTFDILKKNVELNEFKNVTLYNKGFSNNNQTLTFYFDPLASGSASARNLIGSASTLEVTSEVQKLDDFIAASQITQLDFIKCDVEGAELFVYQGGMETLKRFKPIIFTEMLRKWAVKFNYHPNDIITLLADLGYRCFTAQKDKLVEFFVMTEETLETNFFFLHSEKHASKIQQLSN